MESKLHPNHEVILDRFVQACQSDNRVVAAFLVGSYVKGRADEHSDLDLYVITSDEAYDDFVAGRESFVRLLGEPLFLEDFDLPDIVFLIFPDGSWFAWGFGWPRVADNIESTNFESMSFELLTSFVKDIHTTWRPRRLTAIPNIGTALNQSLDAKKRAYHFGLPGDE